MRKYRTGGSSSRKTKEKKHKQPQKLVLCSSGRNISVVGWWCTTLDFGPRRKKRREPLLTPRKMRLAVLSRSHHDAVIFFSRANSGNTCGIRRDSICNLSSSRRARRGLPSLFSLSFLSASVLEGKKRYRAFLFRSLSVTFSIFYSISVPSHCFWLICEWKSSIFLRTYR